VKDHSTDDLDWDDAHGEAIQARSGQVEFDWFARDAQGHVAVLASFGSAPSPWVIRESRVDFNAPVMPIRFAALNLPPALSARVPLLPFELAAAIELPFELIPA
jgi:hypothetical protein